MKQFLSYTFARTKRLLNLDFYYKRIGLVKVVVDAYKMNQPWIFNALSMTSYDKYRVVHLTNREKGVRFNQMIAEGLLNHPNIEEVYFNTDYISFGKVKKSKDFDVLDKMKSCDLIFIPNREHFGLPEYLKFIDENEYWGKVIFYDKKDSQAIDSEILSKCLLYVKRSFPNGYARLPRRIHPKLLPLDYSYLKEYSELSRLDLHRDIDISCFFQAAEKISDRRTRIAKILLGRSAEFENSSVGNVTKIGSDARRAIYETFENNMLHPYFQKMCRSKVIITAYPADWDGDSRTYEAFASGALVVMDRTYIPSPHPIEDGKHALIYDATSDQSVHRVLDRIKYYLNHDEEREEIAKAGREFVSKHHSSVARVDLILQHAKKAMSL